MILIPAKMLRPKHVGDYWVMHGLGLLAMALACAMASDGEFIVLFGLYAVSFVWSLVTFQLYRELGPELAAAATLSGGRWRAIRPAARWAIVAGIIAIPVFWATPRSGSQWELGINSRGRIKPASPEGPVDLNTVGTLTVNRERHLKCTRRCRRPARRSDLSPDQRWRVYALHNYDNGRWVRNQYGFQSADTH